MTQIERHWLETKELVGKINSKEIAKWLLEQGYYPEQYIFPPNFRVVELELQNQPYNKAPYKNGDQDFSPKLSPSKILNISYPKSELTDRIFGIYAPKSYHDIVWYIEKHWNQIRNHLFKSSNKVYSYSFPIPVTNESVGALGGLRTGRMIYEYLELAEKDLLSESYKYQYLLKTDIKNFYPSIYTHSISWAIHTKTKIRDDNENNFRLVGNVLDKLIQFGNDRKTNGIPVGPAISDLIAEIILAAVDNSFSNSLRNEEFVAARYKDDYFFLIKNDEQADRVLKVLQNCFKEFNLFINEEKTSKLSLPDGLLRPWILRFNKAWYGLITDETRSIKFRDFFTLAQEVLQIDSEYPRTAIIDKFLANLTDKSNNYSLKIDYSNLKKKQQAVFRTYSLLMHLAKRSKKSFPNAIGVLEAIFREPEEKISREIKNSLIEEMKIYSFELQKSEDEHRKIWWVYFILTNDQLKSEIDIKGYYRTESLYLKSFQKGSQKFFNESENTKLFIKPLQDLNNPISKHLNIFKKE